MFINTDTLEYPVSELQIKDQFPNTSFSSEFVPPHPYAVVFGTAEPIYDPDTHRIKQVAPVLNNDRWEQAWSVIELTDQQKQERQQAKYTSASQTVRSERDSLLQCSDWTQAADAPVDKTAWAAYRQALRDLPDQPGFPWDITWPTKPE